MGIMEIKQKLIANKLFYKFYIFYYGNKALIRGLKYADQSEESKIYQISHRLERGLCLDKKQYKNRWGFRKANELVELISKQQVKNNNDSVKIGCSVLAAYIQEKEEKAYKDEIELLNQLKDNIKSHNLKVEKDDKWGGIVKVDKDEMKRDQSSAINLFFGRHSCRDFSSKPVTKEEIRRAIEMANMAPSSCNRQATDVYILEAKDREKIMGENIFGADKYLIICGRMDSFGTGEINDWIISSSIFCGYLSMAFQAIGVGSVFMRKQTIGKSEYNDSVRKLCKIPDNQQIIIEMGIGNYCDSFYVPISKRRSVDEILHL